MLARILIASIAAAGVLFAAHAEDKAKTAGAKPAAPAADAVKPANDAAVKTDALEPFRKLAGDWVGKSPDDDTEFTISYRVVGSGSAVVEEMFKGTPHEMVTVYHLDGDAVMLTHYCAAKNQPRMKAVKGEKPNEVRFEFAGGTNIDPATTMHMHSMVITFAGPNEYRAEWQHYDGGKSAGVVKFDMKRKAS